MSLENPAWGTPRIRSELRLVGYEASKATVNKYKVRRRKRPSQTWRTFLDNHVRDIVAVDFFTVLSVSERARRILNLQQNYVELLWGTVSRGMARSAIRYLDTAETSLLRCYEWVCRDHLRHESRCLGGHPGHLRESRLAFTVGPFPDDSSEHTAELRSPVRARTP